MLGTSRVSGTYLWIIHIPLYTAGEGDQQLSPGGAHRADVGTPLPQTHLNCFAVETFWIQPSRKGE